MKEEKRRRRGTKMKVENGTNLLRFNYGLNRKEDESRNVITDLKRR